METLIILLQAFGIVGSVLLWSTMWYIIGYDNGQRKKRIKELITKIKSR
jgi:hypothetical protein